MNILYQFQSIFKIVLIISIGAGGRRRILDNGNLVINPVARDDQGIYTCIAQNIVGNDESHGKLLVMRKLLIVQLIDLYIVHCNYYRWSCIC